MNTRQELIEYTANQLSEEAKSIVDSMINDTGLRLELELMHGHFPSDYSMWVKFRSDNCLGFNTRMNKNEFIYSNLNDCDTLNHCIYEFDARIRCYVNLKGLSFYTKDITRVDDDNVIIWLQLGEYNEA